MPCYFGIECAWEALYNAWGCTEDRLSDFVAPMETLATIVFDESQEYHTRCRAATDLCKLAEVAANVHDFNIGRKQTQEEVLLAVVRKVTANGRAKKAISVALDMSDVFDALCDIELDGRAGGRDCHTTDAGQPHSEGGRVHAKPRPPRATATPYSTKNRPVHKKGADVLVDKRDLLATRVQALSLHADGPQPQTRRDINPIFEVPEKGKIGAYKGDAFGFAREYQERKTAGTLAFPPPKPPPPPPSRDPRKRRIQEERDRAEREAATKRVQGQGAVRHAPLQTTRYDPMSRQRRPTRIEVA
ncbi:hypothetical protein EXIGLDRAFT_829865 [Exidia glandulosa HHB12029]|uniref:Uncharacterized protein n=1 Tax=Exidia glandulosa HHB12029 TaxID=1314781 RepID=A0A165P4R4_EXIGL|nr:hypothetical protein EXIGLDRAFT_829865 [Exidia glandulosa HHB12029]